MSKVSLWVSCKPKKSFFLTRPFVFLPLWGVGGPLDLPLPAPGGYDLGNFDNFSFKLSSLRSLAHPSWSSYWSWWGEWICGFCSLESSSELGCSIISRPAPSADRFIPGPWPIGGRPYCRCGSWRKVFRVCNTNIAEKWCHLWIGGDLQSCILSKKKWIFKSRVHLWIS